MVGALRVLHLGQKQGTVGLCSPGMTAVVALRGGAHRRSMFGPNHGWSRGAKCVQGLCAAQVNPYEGRAGLCWAVACSPWRGCGAGGGEAPVIGVPAIFVGYGLLNLVQQGQGQWLVLTEARIRAERSCRASASRSGGGSRRRSRGQVDAGASRAADLPGKVCGGPAEVQRGSRCSSDHRRQGFAGAEVLTGGDLGPKLRRYTGQGRELRPRVGFWLHWEAVAGVGKGNVVVVRRVHGSAEVRCGGAQRRC